MSKIESGHWKLNFDYKYLGSQHVPYNADTVAKIISFRSEVVEGEKGKKDNCVIAELRLLDGTELKPMIVNKTNFKALCAAYKSEDIADFIGKNVAIYVKQKVWNGSEYVNALRFRDFVPKVELKAIEGGELPKAAAYYAKHGNIEAFKAKRSISEEQEKQIIELSKTIKVE